MHDFINARQQLQTLAEKRKDFLEKIDSRIEYFKDQFLELLEKEWTIEDGELTPTLKVKRKVILSRYEALVDSMYK